MCASLLVRECLPLTCLLSRATGGGMVQDKVLCTYVVLHIPLSHMLVAAVLASGNVD